MFHTRGQATTQTQATRRASTAARPRSILLVLALLAALGAPLTGAAAAALPAAAPAADTLELTPVKALTDVKKPVRYTAELVNADGRSDVTSRTTLHATGPAPCHQGHGDLSCDDNGSYKVTGVLDDPVLKSKPVALEVVNPGVDPAFEPPPPASPPNREVTVQGHTGSCSQEGTLSSAPLEVDQHVTGIFTATFSIPSGTFPGTYPLSLKVRCNQKPQGTEVLITVSNQPPDAVNDLATVMPGGSVPIPVTDNDSDPDGDDGYKTLLEADRPNVGTADPAGEVIVYKPGPGFVDRDQFTYRNCDVVGKRATDCDEATVVVTKSPPEPKADRARTEQGREISILVTENDGGPEPAKLRVRTDPKHGTAVVKEPRDGNIVYTPEPGFADEDSFEYDYCEGVVPGPNVAAPDACPSATVTIEVTEPPVLPAIEKVTLNPTPPNREVVVTGTTGSCSQSGTLILHIPSPGSDVSAPVSGRRGGAFEATLTVPGGTFVDTYELDLQVDCQGKLQSDRETLAVVNRAPDAVDDRAETPEGAPVTIPVTDNDTDPDGDDGYQTSLEASQPDNGGTEVLSGDQIRYTPDQGFSGDDPFTYTLCDISTAAGKRDCDTATVTVTVIGDRRPQPVDDPDESTVKETEVPILVTANDIDPDPERLQVRTNPKEGGTAVVQDPPRDGHILYRPPKGFTGTDSFTYDYCRSVVGVTARSACRFATVTVDVKPPRVDPRIDLVDPAASPPNRAVVVKGTTGTCDKAAKLTLNSAPTAATPAPVTGGQNGGFEAKLEIPAGTFVGPYVLTFHAVCSGAEKTVERGLTVENKRPDAVDDRVTIDSTAGALVPIKVLDNDTDPDGDDGYATRLTVEDDPAHGTAKVQDDQTTIGYTPGEGFKDAGEDRFSYRLCDIVDAAGATDCDTATVTVTKLPPEAVDDPGITTVKDEAVVIRIMGNDRNAGKVDIPNLQVRPDPKPEGKPRLLDDGTIEYQPAPGATGADSFQYDYCRRPIGINAAQNCRPATVTVDVKPLPQITSVTPNPTPPDREVAVTGTTGPCPEGTLTLPIPQPGQDDVKVAVTANQDGTFEAPLKVPGGTFVGTYTLALRVDCDGRERVTQATLEVRNQPPDAVDDRAQTARGRSVTIDVTGNDTDPDGDDGYRTSLAATQPDNGATEVLSGDRVRYTPDDVFGGGEDHFTYTLCETVDANGRRDCDTAIVTVTVTDTRGPVISSVEPGSTPPGRGVEVAGNTGACGRAGTLALQGTSATAPVTGDQDGAFTASLTVPAGTFPKPYRLELRVDCGGQPQRAEAELVVTNQAPEAADDAASTARDQAVRIRVADNDRDPDDPDGYPTRVLVTDPPDRGTAQEQPDLTVVYTPAPGVVGEDQFSYSLCDDVLDAAGRANCGTATVTVNVTDVPVISSVEPAATSPGRPVKVVGNTGSCDQAGTLTFRGETDLRIDVTGDRNGRFTADFSVPERTFPGARRLELVVDCGGQLQRAVAELTVVNQAPVAADDQVTTSPDVSTTIDVTRNDRDPDDPDTYPTLLLVTDPPDHGTAEVRSDLSVVYTPDPGFVDEDQFVYSLCDDLLNPAGQPDCGTATVTVRVDRIACAAPAGQDARLRVAPDRGRKGTRLHITAAVDPRLATCQFRLLLGGTPLGPDVSVGDDGSISADRDVPGDTRPGRRPVRLATLTAETVDEIPFEVTRGWWPPWPPWLPRLLLSAGLLVAGFLARAVFKRQPRPDERPDRRPVADPPNDLRAEPHTRPVEPTVEPVNDNTRTVAVRLEPHPDTGVQIVETLEEVTR